MIKSFYSHQFLNEKKDNCFLLSLRCISILIMIAFIYIPLQGFSYNGPRHYRFKDVRITGTVKDEKGNPLAGVSVAVVGQASGVSTDNSGNFSISVQPSAELSFSYVGYKAVTVKVGDQTHLDITLTSEASTLNEVTVTALGLSRKKKSLGYSVSEVSSEDLVKASNPSVLKSLDGKVSGVNFTNLSSDPTSSVMVNVRGSTALPSLSSGGADVSSRSQPLYVIDGIPVGAQTFTPKDGVDFGNILSQLNPEDIASVTILKGGSAGALYGAQGGNGVVMITTKSGRGGQKGLGVTYNVSAC